MPKDYKSFVLVATYLAKNAHRYYSADDLKEVKKEENETTQQTKDTSSSSDLKCRDVHQQLTIIRTLKCQNCICEQQEKVSKLKEVYGSYRDNSRIIGIPLKTVHGWCASPKDRIHQGTERSKLKRDEFTNFLMQDTISYSHPGQKYSGKKFLMHMWNEIFKRYSQQPDFHKNGLISKTSMRIYKPKNILLSGKTPANQCLCDICENCELMRKALIAAGMKNLQANKYECVDVTLCETRHKKFETTHSYPPIDCVNRTCEECGAFKLRKMIKDSNSQLLWENKRITWHKWQVPPGHTIQRKMKIRNSLKSAVNDFLVIVEDISDHLFRANWHRNVFQYMKSHLQRGYVLQVMDFVMNFANRYQDEVQSAYYGGTQTTIHATMNFYKCQTAGCSEIVTFTLVHI